MKGIILKSFLVGLIVFIMGFGAMWLFWNYVTYPAYLPGLFSYYSSSIGDSFFLPIMSSTFTLFFLIPDNKVIISKHTKKLIYCIILTGCITGIALQFHWLTNPNIGLNWTLTKPRHFNVAGWYHAVFLVSMFGLVCFFFVRLWIIINIKESHSLLDILICSMAMGSGAGFFYTFVIDNFTMVKEELYLFFLVFIFVCFVFFIFIFTALYKRNKNMIKTYSLFILWTNISTMAFTYVLIYKNSIHQNNILFAVISFCLSVAYLSPNYNKIYITVLKYLLVTIPCFILTLIVTTCSTTPEFLCGAILIIVMLVCFANMQFLGMFNVSQYSNVPAKVNLVYGTILMAILFFLFWYNQLDVPVPQWISLGITLVVNSVGFNCIKGNMRIIMKKEKEKSKEDLELSSIKKIIYFNSILLFLGAVLMFIFIYLLEDIPNIAYSILYVPKKISFKLIGITISVIFILIIHPSIMKKIGIYHENRIQIMSIILSLLLYICLINLIIECNESINNLKINLSNCSFLFLTLGTAFLISEGFYSNALILCSRVNKTTLTFLSVIIFLGTLSCSTNILITDKTLIMLNNMNHHYFITYFILSIIIFVFVPTILSRSIDIIDEVPRLVIINYNICIFFDCFLYFMIFTFSGLMYDLVCHYINSFWYRLGFLVTMYINLGWILNMCMVLNVEHFYERKHTAEQQYDIRVISYENQQIFKKKTQYLAKHLCRQNIISMFSLFPYSIIIVAVIILSRYLNANTASNDVSLKKAILECKSKYLITIDLD